jgi:hypothetical protein
MMLAAVAMLGFAVSTAQASETWMTNKNCQERLAVGWCSAEAFPDGWKLKYQSKSRPDLMDLEWQHEVWTKDNAAVLCMYSAGRGGVRINECRSLQEVAAQ